MASATSEKNAEIPHDVKNTYTSVEDVTLKLDALCLSLFEAVRGHQAAPPPGRAETSLKDFIAGKAQDILKAHEETAAAIDNLAGIDTTQEEQEMIISQLMADVAAKKKNIIDLEKRVLAFSEKIDAELEELLTDDTCGLKK